MSNKVMKYLRLKDVFGGIKNIDIVFTLDYYNDNLYPDKDIPIDFIKKLINN